MVVFDKISGPIISEFDYSYTIPMFEAKGDYLDQILVK
jgi:hypothetical protein